MASAGSAAAPGPSPARVAGIPATESSQPGDPADPKGQPHSGWMIQIGAFADESEAREHLQAAQTLAKAILRRADPFTERVTKGTETLYRARFAGLTEGSAEAACRYFKRNRINCFALKN